MPGVDLTQFAVGGAARPDAISGLNPQFANSIAQMFAAAPPDVQSQLRLTSAYRSPTRQAEILSGSLAKRVGPDAVSQWQNYVNQAGGNVVAAGEAARPWLRRLGITKWVAPPGSSNHQKGVAADLQYLNPTAVQWAHANAPKFGLNFPLGNEDWHLEPANARSGGAAPTSIASMFAGTGAPPAVQPGGVSAAYSPMGAQPALGSLALMFAQQQADRQRQQEDEQQAEQVRRAALFGANGVASLYG